jgi:hypothetical protein
MTSNKLFCRFFESDKLKKERFAKQVTNSQTVKVWGEKYGHTLAPPLNREEVETFERNNDVQIPEDLKHYLLSHSSELIIDCYPCKFDLKDYYKNENNNIPLTCDQIVCNNQGVWTCMEKGREMPFNVDEVDQIIEDLEGTSFRIAHRGCAFRTYIILKGNQAGSIWSADDEEYKRLALSFKEYIVKTLASRS